MEVMHCGDSRAERQKVFLETEDGRFRYQLFMDYAKGLPEEYKLVPLMGNISGGCVDKDDNLYCGLRGGSFMSPETRTCLIKLDPEGKYLGHIGDGLLGHLHFFECTDHGTIVLVQTNDDYAIEMTMDGKEIVRTFGEKGKPSDSGRDSDRIYNLTRIHKGIFATEPFLGNNGGSYAQYLNFQGSKLAGPFNKPTDVDVDSKGNYYFTDGYGNVAVHKFDRDGRCIKTWGGVGVFDPDTDTPGRFLVPHSLCVDVNDNIWVCDREKDAVHVFDAEGGLLAYCSNNMGQPSGVDTDGQYIYVVGRGGYLTIFDLAFHVVGELGFFNGNLRGHHLAADSRGNLYLFPTHANFEHQIIALKRVK